MLQWRSKIPRVTTKTRHRQINNWFKKKKLVWLNYPWWLFQFWPNYTALFTLTVGKVKFNGLQFFLQFPNPIKKGKELLPMTLEYPLRYPFQVGRYSMIWDVFFPVMPKLFPAPHRSTHLPVTPSSVLIHHSTLRISPMFHHLQNH